MLWFASFEPDTEAVTWFSGEWSFRRHRSRAFGKTNQAPIQRFNVRCFVFLIQASKPLCRTLHQYRYPLPLVPSALEQLREGLTYLTYLPPCYIMLRLSRSSVYPASSCLSVSPTSSHTVHPTPTYPPKCMLDCPAPQSPPTIYKTKNCQYTHSISPSYSIRITHQPVYHPCLNQ